MGALAGIGREKLTMYFEFLDELRDLGTINMFGVAPNLADAYDIPKLEARAVLAAWQTTFGKSGDRAAIALENAA